MSRGTAESRYDRRTRELVEAISKENKTNKTNKKRIRALSKMLHNRNTRIKLLEDRLEKKTSTETVIAESIEERKVLTRIAKRCEFEERVSSDIVIAMCLKGLS